MPVRAWVVFQVQVDSSFPSNIASARCTNAPASCSA